MMYESPIEVVHEQLKTKFEGDVVKVVQSYNINVDKDELIKALAYDRDQYGKGYRDAMATIVRCKDCEWSEPTKARGINICNYWSPFRDALVRDDGFCHRGERKG